MFAVVRSSSLVAALPKVWLNVDGGRPVSPECAHPAPRTPHPALVQCTPALANRVYLRSVTFLQVIFGRQSGSFFFRSSTTSSTMSPRNLPPELLDHIADFLCDSSDALKSCCLVSKSWIPRARKHLFAEIQFRTIDDLESWEAIFPDPSTSPVHYTKTLFGCCSVVAAAAKEDRWVSAFSSVVHLTMSTLKTGSSPMAISLVPFHGFSLALKSLRLVSATFTPSQIFDLICSFPLLEDLSLHTTAHVPTKDGDFKKQPTIIQPSNLPAFTGSLTLSARHGMDPFVSRLLSLPNDLHFRNLDLAWYLAADVSSSTELVEGCCSTLESLKIHGYALGALA